jgi:hypothetical protein
VITPYAGSSTGFVKEWRKTRAMADPRFYFGFGYGADMNGFGAQGGPRNGPNPVKYPFKSFDGAVTLDRQRSGQRVYDVNTDGVDHYGLYPDWIEDLRKLAGDQIIKDMARGAEAYLQMWERAEGIQNVDCRAERGVLNRRGGNRVRLGATPEQTLRSAGQPGTRQRAWRWCVKGPNSPRSVGVTAAVFTPQERVGLLSSTAPGHKALGYGRGARVGRIAARTRPFGRGLRTRRMRGGTRLVFGVRRGRITFTAVAAPAVARTPARLRGYLRLAGLR